MKVRSRFRCAALATVFAAAVPLLVTAQSEISSFAFVQPDGTMRVAGYRFRLYGIYIPPTGQTCYTFAAPMECGSRASLALQFRISGDFVRCLPRGTSADGLTTASCRSGTDDLSEWMLQRGWAVALPDAPFEYVAMERIAQSRGVGIWGIPIDNRQRR